MLLVIGGAAHVMCYYGYTSSLLLNVDQYVYQVIKDCLSSRVLPTTPCHPAMYEEALAN